jgi:hypothetical protein
MNLHTILSVYSNGVQGQMVQETQPASYVSLALLMLHGRGDDLWIRLTTDRHAAILATIQQM